MYSEFFIYSRLCNLSFDDYIDCSINICYFFDWFFYNLILPNYFVNCSFSDVSVLILRHFYITINYVVLNDYHFNSFFSDISILVNNLLNLRRISLSFSKLSL